MQLVVFRLGNENFGVNVGDVKEIIRVGEVTAIPNAPRYIDGIINLRGRITTIVNLRKKLGMETGQIDNNSRIIVLENEQSNLGMIVDSVAEVKYIKDEQIDTLPAMFSAEMDGDCFQGICKLPDQLLILIDLKKVIRDLDMSVF